MKAYYMKNVFLFFLFSPLLFYSQDKKCFKSYKKEIDSLLIVEKTDLAQISFNNMIISCENNSQKIKKIQNSILKKHDYNVIDNNVNSLITSENKDVYRSKPGILVKNSLRKETPPPSITNNITTGFVEKKKELIKSGIFDDANLLGKNGYLLVTKANKYGVYNSKFEELLPIEYDEIVDQYNYLIIKKNEKQSIYNFKNEKITLPFFREIHSKKYTSHSPKVRNFVFVYKTHNHDNGLFYTDGTVFIDFPEEGKEQDISINEDEQIIRVNRNDATDLLYNFDGKILVSGYHFISYSDDKNLIVAKNNEGEYGVIDINNKIIIPFSNTKISDWGDFFLLEKNGKNGIMDGNGKLIIPIVYDDIDYPYYDTFVVEKNNKKGLINKFNRFVIEPKYEDLDNFRGDRLYYEYLKFEENKLVGLMDIRGNMIIPTKYDHIGVAKYNFLLFAVYKDGKVGMANAFGKEIIPPIYDKYSQYTEDDILEFEKDGKTITIANPEIPPKIQQVVKQDVLNNSKTKQ